MNDGLWSMAPYVNMLQLTDTKWLTYLHTNLYVMTMLWRNESQDDSVCVDFMDYGQDSLFKHNLCTTILCIVWIHM